MSKPLGPGAAGDPDHPALTELVEPQAAPVVVADEAPEEPEHEETS